MNRSDARAHRADHPLSPSGTPPRRARRWPVRAGIVAVAGFALAAPMVAADPALAPEPAPEPAGDAMAAEISRAVPAAAISQMAPVSTGPSFAERAQYSLVILAGGLEGPEVPEAEPEPAPTTTEAPTTTTEAPTTTTEAPTTTTEAPAPPPTTEAPTTTTEAPTTTTEAPAPPPTTEAPATQSVSNGSVWDQLAECEATGDWSANTGNGYYGGLQFSESSWRAAGGTGLPHEASRETQIAMGENLKAMQGWGAWPACSAKLGLR